MDKLNFSGHESFYCRALWLPKGYHFIKEGKQFNQGSAVADLGVGRNMVSSIKFWLEAFNICGPNRKLTRFAHFIFGIDGVDPYLEDPATLWLLHYYLVTVKRASIYHLVFNEFRKERIEFNDSHLERYIWRKLAELNQAYSPKTIETDIAVFRRTYIRPRSTKQLKAAAQNIEENFSSLLIDLDLVEERRKGEEKTVWYSIENSEREDIPEELILFCILDNSAYGQSISLQSLLSDVNSVGSVFALNGNGLIKKIKRLIEKYPNTITYKDDAGIREIQFKKEIDPWNILRDYYER
jgi:hypothetical protein